ncbi:MAG TPA: hypothetical protein VGN12_20700 [Pirellulales bacterium]|jgi:hypothetical protein
MKVALNRAAESLSRLSAKRFFNLVLGIALFAPIAWMLAPIIGTLKSSVSFAGTAVSARPATPLSCLIDPEEWAVLEQYTAIQHTRTGREKLVEHFYNRLSFTLRQIHEMRNTIDNYLLHQTTTQRSINLSTSDSDWWTKFGRTPRQVLNREDMREYEGEVLKLVRAGADRSPSQEERLTLLIAHLGEEMMKVPVDRTSNRFDITLPWEDSSTERMLIRYKAIYKQLMHRQWGSPLALPQ